MKLEAGNIQAARPLAREMVRLGNVRAMEPRDIPVVSSMFTRIFRKREGAASEELRQYIETIFFGSPLYTPENGSIVYDDGTGGIGSAILALPMEFTVNGRRTVAKLLCAFMSEGKAGAVGAACLARAMRAAKQDMCFSDNASPVSADHWMAAGGIVLPIQSLDWRRSFRPLKAWALTIGRQLPLQPPRSESLPRPWAFSPLPGLRHWRPRLAEPARPRSARPGAEPTEVRPLRSEAENYPSGRLRGRLQQPRAPCARAAGRNLGLPRVFRYSCG